MKHVASILHGLLEPVNEDIYVDGAEDLRAGSC